MLGLAMSITLATRAAPQVLVEAEIARNQCLDELESDTVPLWSGRAQGALNMFTLAGSRGFKPRGRVWDNMEHMEQVEQPLPVWRI